MSINDIIHYLIQANFTTIIVIVSMSVFLHTNHFFDKKIVLYFKIELTMLLIIAISDSIEFYTSCLDYSTTLRIMMSAIGYSLRPALMFLMIFIVERNQKIFKSLLIIPLIINTFLSFSALFCKISFSYSPENEYIRGFLGYTPFLTTAIYLVVLVLFTVHTYQNKNNAEILIVIALVIINILSTVYESITNRDGFINSTASISIVFYYIYLTTQQFKRDPLTSVFNRRCFFIDAETNKNVLKAVISLDLNNLKHINDSMGHEYGDRAICEMAKCIQNSLIKNSFLYRVGGDEFMILCFHQNKGMINKIPYNIREAMKNTPYSCAIGVAFLEDGIGFKSACDIADLRMYNDKQHQKTVDN